MIVYILLLMVIIISIYSGILICDHNGIRRKDISFLFMASISVGGFAHLLKLDYITGCAAANFVVGIIFTIRGILNKKGWI